MEDSKSVLKQIMSKYKFSRKKWKTFIICLKFWK